jgi:hypothetical protein
MSTINENATVSTPCKAYSDNFPKWDRIRDAVAGTDAIKAKTTQYLPDPDPTDTSDAGRARYKSYLHRAKWYGVTGQTVEALVGLVFSKPTTSNLPRLLETIKDNADGQGLTLDQFGKKLLTETMQYARAGILVDFPKTETATSVADVQAGNVRPKLAFYSTFDIINWRTKSQGSSVFLELVVLKETHSTVDAGGFGVKEEEQYRELVLLEDGYHMRVWRKGSGDGAVFSVVEDLAPTGADGKKFDRIPFVFIGAKSNTPDVDKPPLLDMADLNIGHYNDSADYQEAVHILGQPQLIMTGITKDWIKDVWKDKGVRFGSRVAIALPLNATAELLQVQPNMIAKEAMDQKERQMAALGATLVEQRSVEQTAKEAGFNESAKTSILSAGADNVSDGITRALVIAGLFVGEQQSETTDANGSAQKAILFELSTDFDNAQMTSGDRAQLLKEYNDKVLSFTELRTNLKQAGVAFQDDQVARDEADNDPNLALPEPTQKIPPFNQQ